MAGDFAPLIRRVHQELNHYRARRGLPALRFAGDEMSQDEANGQGYETMAKQRSAEILRRLAAGEQTTDIATALGISKGYCYQIAWRAKHPKGGAPERAQLPRVARPTRMMPQVELDFVPTQHFVEQAIAIYARKLDALRQMQASLAALQE